MLLRLGRSDPRMLQQMVGDDTDYLQWHREKVLRREMALYRARVLCTVMGMVLCTP